MMPAELPDASADARAEADRYGLDVTSDPTSADGQPLGSRGRRTRQRILAAVAGAIEQVDPDRHRPDLEREHLGEMRDRRLRGVVVGTLPAGDGEAGLGPGSAGSRARRQRRGGPARGK